MPKFVERDASQRYLLPPEIGDWVPTYELAHFPLEDVERVAMSEFEVSEQGTGSAQDLVVRSGQASSLRSQGRRLCLTKLATIR